MLLDLCPAGTTLRLELGDTGVVAGKEDVCNEQTELWQGESLGTGDLVEEEVGAEDCCCVSVLSL